MKKLQSVLNKWVKRLRLQAWDIEFNVLSEDAYHDLEQQVGIDPGDSEAHIIPCSSRSCAQLNMMENDVDSEVVIIHELMHLNQNGMKEVAIEMANAIDNKALAQHMMNQFIAAHEISVHATARALLELEQAKK